jgi:hypothetical protein
MKNIIYANGDYRSVQFKDYDCPICKDGKELKALREVEKAARAYVNDKYLGTGIIEDALKNLDEARQG